MSWEIHIWKGYANNNYSLFFNFNIFKYIYIINYDDEIKMNVDVE